MRNEDSKIRVAIFLNGEPPSKELLDKVVADKVICADGALNYLEKCNTMIDIVVSDFDSFIKESPELVQKRYSVRRFAKDKDKTDGELALDTAIELGATEVDFYGASGKRDDHFLGNIALLFKAVAANVRSRIVTDYNTIYPIVAPCDFFLKTREGQIISLVPLSDKLHIISTKGLKYPLKNKALTLDNTLFISNVAQGDGVTVKVKNGKGLLLVVD